MIKRNELCWCGSKRKFKKCHLFNDDGPYPKDMLDVGKAREYFYNSKECLALDQNRCTNKIIKAHTISKSANLKPIAEDGKVLTFKRAVKQTYEEHWIPELVVTKNASTLLCFCSYHDKEIFENIDCTAFEINKKTAFLLSYRSIIKEYFEKSRSVKLFKLSETYMRTQNEFRYISSLAAEEAALACLEHAKKSYESILKTRRFNDYNFYVVELPVSTKIVCSAAALIDVGVDGQIIQNLSDLKSNKSFICVNSIINDGNASVIFGWDSDSEVHAKALIDTFKASKKIVENVVYYIFTNFGNICMNPSWYNGLDSDSKETLEYALNVGGMSDVPRTELFPLNRTLNLN